MNNKITAELITTIKVGNQLGEGVQWHIQSQLLWWTDIQNACLFSYCLTSKKLCQYGMPERVGCFGFIENSDRLIIAFETGFALFDIKINEIEWLARPEMSIKGNRFNDGRIDRQGRFWAGTMNQNETAPTAKLYCYDDFCDSHKQCTELLSNITVSNGLCFSPDGKTMYHADSPTREIYQYDFDIKTAQLSNKKRFAITDEGCFPDGSCIDEAGYLWNAQWAGSQIVRYQPDGEIDWVLKTNVSQPSCVAIGGPNMDLLFITSAKQGLNKSQLKQDDKAGHVFIYQLNGIKGLSENQFVLNNEIKVNR